MEKLFTRELPSDGRATARRVDETASDRADGAAQSGKEELRMRMSASPPSRSRLDRGVGFWKNLAWTSILLASALYIVGRFEPFSYAICLTADDVGPGLFNNVSVINDEDAGKLFGMDTEPASEGALQDKWRRVQAGIAKDLDVIAQCLASRPCPAPAQKLIGLSREGAGRSERARLGVINRAVNLAITPMSDETQWGVSDHWSDPFETLHTNSGDCEDYAIVKYVALLTAGLSKDAVKIVVLRNRLPNEDHAVAAVRVDDQCLILDNRTLTLVRDMDVTRAIPEFVLDDQGVRRFVWSGRNRNIAS